jgi:hypothetical protein
MVSFINPRSFSMLRYAVAVMVALLLMAGNLYAGDKEVKCKVVKVDVKKMILTVMAGDEKKEYTLDDKTKFIGPKGGISEEGIKDDRLMPGAEIRLIVAANNRTVREVHLPERKAKDKK